MNKLIKKSVGQNKKNGFNPIALACALISLPALTVSTHIQAATVNYTGDASDLQTTPGNFGAFNSNIANALFSGVGTLSRAFY